MNDVSGKISLYHNLFQICLILAVICLLLAVILFFVLDIRSTLGYLTGRRAKKKIKELEAVTALSGRLMSKERTNMQYVAQEMKDDMGVRQAAKPGIRKVAHAVETAARPTAENWQTRGMQSIQEQETEVLRENAVEEAVHVMNADASTAMLNAEAGTKGRFVIVRELMMIHTEEVI